jgi:hypothetical protein
MSEDIVFLGRCTLGLALWTLAFMVAVAATFLDVEARLRKIESPSAAACPSWVDP